MSRAERRRNEKAIRGLAQRMHNNRVEVERLMRAGVIPDKRNWLTKVIQFFKFRKSN